MAWFGAGPAADHPQLWLPAMQGRRAARRHFQRGPCPPVRCAFTVLFTIEMVSRCWRWAWPSTAGPRARPWNMLDMTVVLSAWAPICSPSSTSATRSVRAADALCSGCLASAGRSPRCSTRCPRWRTWRCSEASSCWCAASPACRSSGTLLYRCYEEGADPIGEAGVRACPSRTRTPASATRARTISRRSSAAAAPRARSAGFTAPTLSTAPSASTRSAGRG